MDDTKTSASSSELDPVLPGLPVSIMKKSNVSIRDSLEGEDALIQIQRTRASTTSGMPVSNSQEESAQSKISPSVLLFSKPSPPARSRSLNQEEIFSLSTAMNVRVTNHTRVAEDGEEKKFTSPYSSKFKNLAFGDYETQSLSTSPFITPPPPQEEQYFSSPTKNVDGPYGASPEHLSTQHSIHNSVLKNGLRKTQSANIHIRQLTKSKVIKMVSREEEALIFLRNIPMGGAEAPELRNERTIVMKEETPGSERRSHDSLDDDESSVNDGSYWENENMGDKNVDHVLKCTGTKGFVYVTLRNLKQKTEIPGWEQKLVHHGFLDGRMFFAPSKGFPVGITSIIAYSDTPPVQDKPRGIAISSEDLAAEGENKKSMSDGSYHHLLHSSWSECCAERDERDLGHYVPKMEQYYFELFDDPDMKQGKHRTVMSLLGYIQTVLPFVTVSEIKNEINSQFREKNPWMDQSMSLSKIRTLKAIAIEHWDDLNLELSTLAIAFALFERLCHKNFITKINRKVNFCICIFLACKFNEPDRRSKGGPAPAEGGGARPAAGSFERGSFFEYPENEHPNSTTLRKILETLAASMQITVNEVLDNEMNVFVALDFSLHLQLDEIYFHFAQILKRLGMTNREYLGENDFDFHRYISVKDCAGMGNLCIAPVAVDEDFPPIDNGESPHGEEEDVPASSLDALLQIQISVENSIAEETRSN